MQNELSGSQNNDEALGFNLEDALKLVGSGSLPHAMVFFESDGTISSLAAPESIVGKEESESIKFALDYVSYTFRRADWMLEFAQEKQRKAAQENAPKLKLIKGGLDDEN